MAGRHIDKLRRQLPCMKVGIAATPMALGQQQGQSQSSTLVVSWATVNWNSTVALERARESDGSNMSLIYRLPGMASQRACIRGD